jgi:hypothetical protein
MISLNGIGLLVFVMEVDCVLCEVEIGILNTI